jgi:dienelactone hydrolase
MYSPLEAPGLNPSANAYTPRIISAPTTGTTTFCIATMVAWPYSATVTISAATPAYGIACTASFSGVPSSRCPAATIASPLVHTVTAVNPNAMASAMPDPMNRPWIRYRFAFHRRREAPVVIDRALAFFG